MKFISTKMLKQSNYFLWRNPNKIIHIWVKKHNRIHSNQLFAIHILYRHTSCTLKQIKNCTDNIANEMDS